MEPGTLNDIALLMAQVPENASKTADLSEEEQSLIRYTAPVLENGSSGLVQAPWSMYNRSRRVSSVDLPRYSSSTNVSSRDCRSSSSIVSFYSARSSFEVSADNYSNRQGPTTRMGTVHEQQPFDSSISTIFSRLRDDYYENLMLRGIIQPIDKELDWSGKGQHVAFSPQDVVPLEHLGHLGASHTAIVEKVLCRRIALARKTMRCSQSWTVADALREVYHLQNLRHPHIVQLVGSYLQGRNFSILVYPVAHYHLGTFLEDTADLNNVEKYAGQYVFQKIFLLSSLSCLTSAVNFIHDRTTKHMDIKPQNILVRENHQLFFNWRIYLADFGLSRSFAAQDHSQTDGPTSRTPRYCAPEVFHYARRGRAADVFSLGCVFLEIMTVCANHHVQDLADKRRGDGDDESYHANLGSVAAWIKDTLMVSSSRLLANELLPLVQRMLDQEPDRRPSATELDDYFERNKDCYEGRECCRKPPEAYVAYNYAPTESVLSA